MPVLNIDEYIAPVSDDNINGASVVARKFISQLQLILRQESFDSAEDLQKNLQIFCTRIIRSQPAMAPLYSIKLLYLQKLDNILKVIRPVNEYIKEMICLCEEMLSSLDKAEYCLVNKAVEFLPAKFTAATCSRSGIVENILKEAKEAGKLVSVILSESRPVNEGAVLAENLATAGIDVLLVTDAALGYYLKKADLLLTGADRISENRFVNKIGTNALIQMSGFYNKPVYVAATEDKFLPESIIIDQNDSHPPEEIYISKSKNIHIKNQYFEYIDLKYVSNIITENKIYNPGEIQDYILIKFPPESNIPNM